MKKQSKIKEGDNNMKKSFIVLNIILTISFGLVSCSHQSPSSTQDRAVASKPCWDSVKGEYHSYFDQVEKCLEKQSDK